MLIIIKNLTVMGKQMWDINILSLWNDAHRACSSMFSLWVLLKKKKKQHRKLHAHIWMCDFVEENPAN